MYGVTSKEEVLLGKIIAYIKCNKKKNQNLTNILKNWKGFKPGF